jgi:hypothetical protein
MMHEQSFMDNLAPGLFNNLVFIRKLGNKAYTTARALLLLNHLLPFVSLYIP